LSAGVPLGMACIDYRTREVRMVSYAMLTGDLDSDLACIREAYRTCRGYKHECAAPIVFASNAQRELPQAAEQSGRVRRRA